MIRRFFDWLFTPSRYMVVKSRLYAHWSGMPRDDWERPDGKREGIPGFGFRHWRAVAMTWDVYSNDGVLIDRIRPDHERRAQDRGAFRLDQR